MRMSPCNPRRKRERERCARRLTARRKDARVVFLVEEPSCLRMSHLRFPRQIIYDGIRGLWCRMLSEIEESDRRESRCSWAGAADDVIRISEKESSRRSDVKVIMRKNASIIRKIFTDETDSIPRYLICSETQCFPYRFHSICQQRRTRWSRHDRMFFIVKGNSKYKLCV